MKENIRNIINKLSEILNGRNLLCILLVYVIGIGLVIYRNLEEGIPFSTFSVVQYAVLTFYFLVLVGTYIAEKWILSEMLKVEYQGGKIQQTFKCLFFYILMIFVFLVMMLRIFNMFLYETDINQNIVYVIFLYVILPILGSLIKSKKLGNFLILLSIMTSVFITNEIPASIGGLKPITVKFYSSQNDIVHEYLYYGQVDGNYVFKEGENKIILRSIDSGYIEYTKNDSEVCEKKNKYKIEVVETMSRIIELEAESEMEALKNVRNQYNNKKIVLDSGDFVGVEFDILRADIID